MQDYNEIVMALRTAKENENHYIPCSRQFADITADAIEQLVKERNAAIKDMKKCWLCASCKKRIKGKEWAFCYHFEVKVQKVDERNTATCKNYEWRGVSE